MVRCKRCLKTVKEPKSASWEYGICPQCMDCKRNIDLKWEDDTIYRIEVNPVDMYWHEVTKRMIGL